jgi:transposase
MRFVAVKSATQQDVQAVHRVRQQLLKTHTALVNQARGLLHFSALVTGNTRLSIPKALASAAPKRGRS